MEEVSLLTLPDGVRIAVARPKDHRDVMTIRDVYEGIDYLDFTYPFYMSCPNTSGYILYLHEKPVSFRLLYVVDDGESVVSGASRTHASAQGKGYMGYLEQYANYHIQKQLPKPAQRLIYTAFETKQLRDMVNKRPDYTILLQRNLQSYKASKGHITKLTSNQSFQDDTSQLWRPKKDEFIKSVTDPSTIKSLFVDNHVVVFWEPYRPLKSNFSHVYDTSTVFMSGNFERCDAVSFITQVPCKNGVRVDLDLYGNTTDEMLEHINNCLQQISATSYHEGLNVDVMLYFPLCIDKEHIAEMMNSRGFAPGAWSHHQNYVLVQTDTPGFPAKL